MDKITGFADVNGAQLYYEVAGEGTPFVMVHAGVANNRMWDNEFTHFADKYKVLRFDMRGYGKSKPVDGEFNIQDDLETLLETLDIDTPFILMGCSIGGGLAIDFTLTHPTKVKHLILVGSGPAGLDLDAEEPEELFAEAEKAFKSGDIDRAAEIDTQIWFDGVGRTKDDVDATVRAKALDMDRIALTHYATGLGKHVRKEFDKPAVERLGEITTPTLVIVGKNDIEYLRLSADYMEKHLPNPTKVVMDNAAHLPNMEHPEIFRQAIEAFLTSN